MPVAEPFGALPHEKETVIWWDKTSRRFTIDSREGSVVRWLTRHPDFVPEVVDIEKGKIVHLMGTLPMGCIKLLTRPRKSDHHADVLGAGKRG